MIEFDATDATAVAFAIGGQNTVGTKKCGRMAAAIIALASTCNWRKKGDRLKLADYATALAAHPWA